MYPALQAGNNVLVNKWIMGTRIFNIWDALEGKEVKIHRLPGDTLEIRNGFYRIRGIEEKLGKTTCGTGRLSTTKTGIGCKDDNGKRTENTRVRDKDCVKNRVKRAKIVRFTLC